MPVGYIPYTLAHAYLPPPPSPPSSIPELRVPTSRPYPSTSEAYSTPLHPEHATSAIRDPITGLLARSIVNGLVLELRNLDLYINQDHESSGAETIRIFFPEPLRPLTENCIIPQVHDGVLHVLVVSQADVIYRLSFGMGGSRVGKGSRVSFDLRNTDEWCEEYVVPDETVASCGGIGAWIAIDEDGVVLGCGDGGIIRCSRSRRWAKDEATWTAVHHRASSRLRLPSIFSRSAASEEQVISFARFDTSANTTLYAVSRDQKLRVWTTSGSLLKTIDLRTTLNSSQELILRSHQNAASTISTNTSETDLIPLIRVVQHPSKSSRYSHLVVVFVETPHNSSSGTFVVYRASGTDLNFAGDRPTSTHSAKAQLRSFEILPPSPLEGFAGWRLFVSWDLNGSLLAETILMDDLFQFTTYHEPPFTSPLESWQICHSHNNVDSFDPAYFDNILSLDPPNPQEPYENQDISQTFLSHLFYPGRFSILTLQTALEEYIYHLSDRHARPEILAAYPTLPQKYITIVGCTVEMELSPQTGAPIVDIYRRDVKLEWLGVWARVRDLDKHASWPLSTTMLHNQPVVLTREGVKALISEDVGSLVDRLGSSFEESHVIASMTDGSFKMTLPVLAYPEARRGILAVSLAGTSISQVLQQEQPDFETSPITALWEDLSTVLAAGFQEPPEILSGRMWDDYLDPCLTEEDRNTLRRILSDTSSPVRALNSTLDILSDFIIPGQSSSLDALSFSGLGNSLISSILQSTIIARYSLACKIILVSLFHLSESPDPSTEDDDAEELVHLLTRGLVAWHRYHILKFLVEQTSQEAIERAWSRKSKSKTTRDVLSEGFGGLKMQDEPLTKTDSDGYPTEGSLIHSLLADLLRVTPSDGGIRQGVMDFLNGTKVLEEGQVELEPGIGDYRLVYAICVDGHPALAKEMIEMWPKAASLIYVKANASVALGEIDEAVRFFEQAAIWTRDPSIKNHSPVYYGPQGLPTYYDSVSKIFEHQHAHVAVVHFGQLSLQNGVSLNSNPREIWTRVFLANLGLERYEDAYSTMLFAPGELGLRRDFLGQLISVMCENNEVGRLTALGFIGLQKEVEALLGFKARNSDPLRFPNYYKVLYSWHISRGDYRSAGEIMYLQGKRLGESPPGKLSAFEMSAMQARSYLAAMNALSLVDKKNAWISFQKQREGKRLNKRRKTTAYIPEEEFSPSHKPIDLITLPDIQAEYSLVLSQLRLSTQIKDLNQHGVSVSADEAVGLLVQRGLYDLAQNTASSMGVDMTDLFQSLATRCVELSRQRDPSFSPSSAFLRESPITSRLRGPPAALALRYLEVSLSRHNTMKTQYKYREVVADTLFDLNRDKNLGWKMPAWLVNWEMTRNPEGWISRALKWGWVEEALDWTGQLIRNVPPSELLQKGRGDVTILPWNLLDRVLAAAGEGDEGKDEEVQNKVKKLKEDIQRRKVGLTR
ncbi:hypothetical protein M231_01124 [Tremella mesenterica]|uniref:Nuclear pore complex protein Nup160 n=1 Tax=Tremella mesenterica TaxID=5217 RepID=A0A4Q1BU92_TREME|nr:hypothetical protein M231_01124 [Tremella mesenterica]